MKLFVVCLVLIVAVSSTNAYKAFWGKYNKGDVFLYKKIVTLKPSPREQITRYEYKSVSLITYFQATDSLNTGASVKLIGGGPDRKNAAFEFRSKPGKGINFVLEFWGRKA